VSTRRWPRRLALIAVLAVGAQTVVRVAPAALPARLSDAEFWRLSQEWSEPNGFFRSDNLVSNEDAFQVVIPDLVSTVKPGGVYLGVGPDQNFTFIAAVQPGIAFITDIRRGNLLVHLMYKALFELSADRAEFLSRLLARPRPDGLDDATDVRQLFQAFSGVAPSRELYDATFRAVVTHLRTQHGMSLDSDDTEGIAYVLSSFYAVGPYLSYSNSGFPGRGGRYPSFQDLQVATDAAGVAHGYLASEATYRVVRTLEQNNLIVPIVGNFAGPKALKSVGAWVRDHGGTVTTFYASNVEQYLFQDGIWAEFAGNLAALPIDGTSTFVRSCFMNCVSSNVGTGSRAVMMLDSLAGLVKDAKAGRITSYWDVLARRR
jgi:hypothetical protein